MWREAATQFGVELSGLGQPWSLHNGVRGVRSYLSLRVVTAKGDQSTHAFAWPQAEEPLMTEGVAAQASCRGSGRMRFDHKAANLP